jgi:succinate dehydrogenase / fumarate reductase, cytochrome b subunit
VKPIARPVDLNLFRVHLPLPGWVSILHRASGALLFAALPLGVWALSESLADEAGFRRIADGLAHPLARLILLLLFWAFSHHLLAGVRHLALDVHWGVDLRRARQSSLAVMLASGLLTLFAAWRLFA